MRKSPNMTIGVHCILASLYFLLLPTTIAVNSAGNSFLKLAAIPIAVYFVFTIVFQKKLLQLNSVHLLLCLYTLTTLITLFINSDGYSINTVIGYFLNLALYLCLTVVKYNKKEILFLENVQVLLLVILVATTLLSNSSIEDRKTLVIFGQISDPNYFVGFFIFPLSVTLKKIIQSKYRIVYVILVLLGVYCIFLSGSRGGVVAFIALIAAFGLIYPQKIKNKFWLLLAGCSFILCAWIFIIPFLPESIVDRMSVVQVIESGGTGRWYIWKSMMNEIINTPNEFLFGRGINAMHDAFYEGEWHNVFAHNQMIQVLYNQGFVGLIAFIALTIGCFLHCLRKRKTVSAAIIGMMALSISLSFNQTTRTFWNLVAYGAINFLENDYCTTEETLKLPEEK